MNNYVQDFINDLKNSIKEDFFKFDKPLTTILNKRYYDADSDLEELKQELNKMNLTIINSKVRKQTVLIELAKIN